MNKNNLKHKSVMAAALVLVSAVLFYFVPTHSVYADATCADGTAKATQSECAPTTTDACGRAASDPLKSSANCARINPAENCSDCTTLEKDVQLIMNVLIIGVGLVVTLMIVIAGIQYTLARENPQAVQAAKSKITNAVIAMVSFMLIYTFIQWIVPGGLF